MIPPLSAVFVREPEAVWIVEAWLHESLADWPFADRLAAKVGETVSSVVERRGGLIEVRIRPDDQGIWATVSQVGRGQERLLLSEFVFQDFSTAHRTRRPGRPI